MINKWWPLYIKIDRFSRTTIIHIYSKLLCRCCNRTKYLGHSAYVLFYKWYSKPIKSFISNQLLLLFTFIFWLLFRVSFSNAFFNSSPLLPLQLFHLSQKITVKQRRENEISKRNNQTPSIPRSIDNTVCSHFHYYNIPYICTWACIFNNTTAIDQAGLLGMLLGVLRSTTLVRLWRKFRITTNISMQYLSL